MMCKFSVEYVFGSLDKALAAELFDFWNLNQASYQAELKSFRSHGDLSEIEPLLSKQKVLKRQPGAIARNQEGSIVGVVFVVLRELEAHLNLGSHAYFQRMYVLPQARSSRLANQLYKKFLEGFIGSVELRDHRASTLMAENINPGLQEGFMRRYFARLGFTMLGSNRLGGEVWLLKLRNQFIF
ncbi:hypothetical protein [Synechococcus sp. UW140]|uniref:hypothetical protein n=1 Tax=Synechococcus sp. UW140 TaxID=368503 RepID=UPI003137F0B2